MRVELRRRFSGRNRGRAGACEAGFDFMAQQVIAFGGMQKEGVPFVGGPLENGLVQLLDFYAVRHDDSNSGATRRRKGVAAMLGPG